MILQNTEKRLVLGSGSKGRADILRGTGLEFEQIVADVDEPAIRQALFAGGNCVDPKDVAMVLGQAKAEIVSKENADAWVIGADQILAFEGKIYEKPGSLEEARENLLELRGATHFLHSAVCVVKNGEKLWEHVSTASMTLRDFSPEFLGQYLAVAGETVKTSVGAYRLEETGIHLFEKIDGDYFTILGLPILPLLKFLRAEGLIKS